MRIEIRTVGNIIQHISCDRGDPVWKLKQNIENETGHCSFQQHLIFKGRKLSDIEIINEDLITEGDHLVLVIMKVL